jgi:ABC-type transport system substrate-binding protein
VLECSATKYLGDGSGTAPFTAADVQAAFGAGSNNNADSFVNTLTMTFLNGANESGVVATDPSALNAFFTALPTPFQIGVAWTGNNTWYTGWTCNSSYANFGSASGACTSLPVT